MCSLNGDLYVLAGKPSDYYNLLQSAYRYNARHDTWHAMSDIPMVCDNLSAVAVDSKIFVMGGRNHSRALAAAHCYDVGQAQVQADTAADGEGVAWVRMDDLPQPSFGHGAVCCRGTIYIFGGCGGTGDGGGGGAIPQHDHGRRDAFCTTVVLTNQMWQPVAHRKHGLHLRRCVFTVMLIANMFTNLHTDLHTDQTAEAGTSSTGTGVAPDDLLSSMWLPTDMWIQIMRYLRTTDFAFRSLRP